MNKLLFALVLFFVQTISEAQVGIGVSTPHSSAMLHVQDTTRGMLIPRMTMAQKEAIITPAEGLMIYQTNSEKGFWYFSGGQWTIMTPQNNGGKNIIYISDGITNAEAAAKIAAEAGPNTQIVKIIRCSKLTTVTLSGMTNLLEVTIQGNSLLQQVNLDNIKSVDGGMVIDQCPLITSITAPNLQRIGTPVTNSGYSLLIEGTKITNLNWPLLDFISGRVRLANNNLLTSVNFPSFREHQEPDPTDNNAVQLGPNALLSNISFPLLQKVGSLNMNGIPMLAGVNLNSLAEVNALVIGGVVPSVSLPALTTVNSTLSVSSPLMTSFSAPVLNIATVGLSVNSPVMTTLSLPLLTRAGTFTLVSNQLTSLALPSLQRVTTLNINNNNGLTSISLPVFNIATGININSNAVLTSVSMPVLTQISGSASIANNPNLTAININSLTSFTWYMSFNASNNLLSSVEVNYLLGKFVAVTPPVKFGIFDFKQLVPAPPTGQGLTDKATLIARPNTVNTD